MACEARSAALILMMAAAVAGLSPPALALNWEGHDDWFLDTAPFQDFIEGVPPPLSKPQPLCDEMERKHKANPYEQVPIPGRNCRAGDGAKPAQNQ